MCKQSGQQIDHLLEPLCLTWSMWHGHNARTFEDSERTMPELKAIMLKFLLSAMAAHNSSIDFKNLCFWVHVFLLCAYGDTGCTPLCN